jgi:hypothetical protein
VLDNILAMRWGYNTLSAFCFSGSPRGGDMARIFISYAREDQNFVKQLVADLQAAGVQTWVDYQDIKPGDEWDEKVKIGLDLCEAMILVLTEASVASKNVKVEWSYYLDKEKTIYPILLRECEPPLRLRLIHRIDFMHDGTQAFSHLLEVLGVGIPYELPLLKTLSVPEPVRLPFEPETPLVSTRPLIMGSDKSKDLDYPLFVSRSNRPINAMTDYDLSGGGTVDFQWDGFNFAMRNGSKIGMLSGITYENVRYGQLDSSVVNNNVGLGVGKVFAGGVYGVYTAEGRRAVIRVENISGTQIWISYRVYNDTP